MKNTTTILLCKHGALVALCLIILRSCAQLSQKTETLPQFATFIVDSIYLPISESDRPDGRIKEVARGKYAPNEWIAFMKENTGRLYFYDISSGHYLDSMAVDEYLNYYPEFDPIGIDSVYLEVNANKVVRLFGKTKKEWDVTPLTLPIGPKVYIGTLSACPIAVFGDTIFCTTTTSERKKQVGPNLPFLKANYDIQFAIDGNIVKHLARFNPNPKYFEIQDYNANAEKVYLNGHEIVYSFDCSDTLLLHNFSTGITWHLKLKTENFFQNTPYDYSKAASMDYGNSYNMSNSRMGMGSLYYDSTQHRIFQLMQHRGRYIEEDGTKHGYTDLPHSLFVLDDKLNQLAEIYIPPGTLLGVYFSFITHKGLYFAAHSSKQKYHDKMLFYRIAVP